MKKVLTLVLLLTAGLFMAACEETTVDDVKPEITGVGAVTINVGDTFDPMAGVKAEDEVDGIITSDIVVTGTVDTNKAGTYELTYTVKDKAGNEQVVKRTITVLGLAGLANGDFSNQLEGWTTWFNDSQDVDVEYSVVDGKAVIDIKAQSVVMDNNWWDVQLSYKTISFPKFESYTLKFTAYAENDRYLMLNLQGGGMSSKAINEEVVALGTTAQEFSFDFFSKEDVANAELQFSFGTFHKVAGVDMEKATVLGKIYISNVQIVVGPELENQAPVLEGVTDRVIEVGAESFVIKAGISVSDDFDTLTIADVVAEAVGAELTFPAVAGKYVYKYTVTDSEGLEATATRTIHVGSFNVGSFLEVGENGLPVGYEQWAADNAKQTVTTTDGVVSIDIETVGAMPWENQFKISGLMATKGTYEISFKASSSVARTIVFALEQNYGVGVERAWHRVDLTTEMQTFTFTIELSQDAKTSGAFQFFMGNSVGEVGFEDGVYVASIIQISDLMVTKQVA